MNLVFQLSFRKSSHKPKRMMMIAPSKIDLTKCSPFTSRTTGAKAPIAMARPPTLGMGVLCTLRWLGMSIPVFSRSAAALKMGMSAMVMNMDMRRVAKRTIR